VRDTPLERKPKPGTLGNTINELKRGTFIGNARERSSRRKSAWNLLLLFVLPIWLLLWCAGVELAWLVHVSAFEVSPSSVNNFWVRGIASRMTVPTFLMIFPPILPTISGAMVIVNFVGNSIPAARKAMTREDQQFPGTEYAASQSILIRITGILAPTSV
jgi:hypothetical protein